MGQTTQKGYTQHKTGTHNTKRIHTTQKGYTQQTIYTCGNNQPSRDQNYK